MIAHGKKKKMLKVEILKKYQNQEDKILIARVFDKIEEVRKNKQIAYTDFLDMHEQAIVARELKNLKMPYLLWGGFKEASRQVCIFYPECMKIDEIKEKCNEDIQIVRITLPPSLTGTYEHRMYLSGIMKLGIKRQKVGDIVCDKEGADIVVTKELSTYIIENLKLLTRFSKCKFEIKEKCNEDIQIVRITLPTALKGTYEHRIYLSGIMKLGIKRQKVGDIVCDKEGADIVVTKELSTYIIENLKLLTRFSKCKFEILPIKQLKKIEIQKREIQLLVQSLRIDNIVAELLHTSRSQAEEYLQTKKVFVNYENDFKASKLLKEKDIIVIRGKGKFEFDEIVGNTKKNKYVLRFLKYE